MLSEKNHTSPIILIAYSTPSVAANSSDGCHSDFGGSSEIDAE